MHAWVEGSGYCYQCSMKACTESRIKGPPHRRKHTCMAFNVHPRLNQLAVIGSCCRFWTSGFNRKVTLKTIRFRLGLFNPLPQVTKSVCAMLFCGRAPGLLFVLCIVLMFGQPGVRLSRCPVTWVSLMAQTQTLPPILDVQFRPSWFASCVDICEDL